MRIFPQLAWDLRNLRRRISKQRRNRSCTRSKTSVRACAAPCCRLCSVKISRELSSIVAGCNGNLPPGMAIKRKGIKIKSRYQPPKTYLELRPSDPSGSTYLNHMADFTTTHPRHSPSYGRRLVGGTATLEAAMGPGTAVPGEWKQDISLIDRTTTYMYDRALKQSQHLATTRQRRMQPQQHQQQGTVPRRTRESVRARRTLALLSPSPIAKAGESVWLRMVRVEGLRLVGLEYYSYTAVEITVGQLGSRRRIQERLAAVYLHDAYPWPSETDLRCLAIPSRSCFVNYMIIMVSSWSISTPVSTAILR
jgi:hypothetical protein